MPSRPPVSADVRITRHATEQLLIRFPEDLLPRDPVMYLRTLLGQATIATRPAHWYQSCAEHHPTLNLRVSHWVLVLTPNRRDTPAWVLVTVKRTNSVETDIPRALRGDRLRNNEMFRTGEAAVLLRTLIRTTGTENPRALANLWVKHRYPLILHGGFRSFEAFLRAAIAARTTPSTPVGYSPTA